jgi:hypothetical protein
MIKKKIDFDYTQGKKPFREVYWINLITGEKELIRIPIAKTMREAPLIEYHVSELVYKSWKKMGSCKIDYTKELED